MGAEKGVVKKQKVIRIDVSTLPLFHFSTLGTFDVRAAPQNREGKLAPVTFLVRKQKLNDYYICAVRPTAANPILPLHTSTSSVVVFHQELLGQAQMRW